MTGRPEDDGKGRSRPKRRRKRPRRRADRRPRAASAPDGRLSLESLTHQRRLALSGCATAVGLALVGIDESLVGSLVVLGGLIALMLSIHRYGRLGVERPRRG